MKAILSSRRHRYLARVSIFLVMVALIAGMTGCGGGGGDGGPYTLTVNSTAGGVVAVNDVIIPGKTMFIYDPGTVVSLNATPDAGYCFVNWTGDVSTVANVTAAITNITMNGNYSITANFHKPEIYDWYDLDAIRNSLDGHYTLMNNLNSTTGGYAALASSTANGGKGWQPIGTKNPPFTGTFNGQGYEIRDLFINRPGETYVGLFGYVAAGGVIENVGVVNTDMTGYLNVGSLVGWNVGTVSNSYSTGNVTGNWSVGGLMGVLAGGIVSNSYYNYDEVLINGENIITTGALFNEDFQQWLANDKFLDINGRLSQENGYYVVNNVSDFKQLLAFGQNASLKFTLKNDLDLATEPNFYIPYLAGEFDGDGHKISNLSFDFDFVTGVGLFGGLASGGKITRVGVENVNITGTAVVGGLLGGNTGTVSNSYSTGNVTGVECVGGLVGVGAGNVSNSYSTSSVTGMNLIGGLVGCNWGGTVSNSYSIGNVTGNWSVGGLMGQNLGTVNNSFWDTQTSGQNISAGGTGKNTTEMQNIITFSGAGWNITTVANPSTRNPAYIWNIVNNVTYPFLSWQP